MIKDLKVEKKFQDGFTLVELLVVVAILAIMISILIGILNPTAIVNKAKDSQRKNDLNKIKIAFEGYSRDKGRYPSEAEIKTWNIAANCGNQVSVMKSYFDVLPCDPNGIPYIIEISDSDTFKVTANLENKKDNNIPKNWYSEDTYPDYVNKKDLVNYGVSSSNILWYESESLDPSCLGNDCIECIDGSCTPWKNFECFTGGNVQCRKGNPDEICNVSYCCNGSGCD